MSQENVEIMRRYYAAWLRRDPSEMGTLDPDIELHPDPETSGLASTRVWTLRQGKAIRVDLYNHREEAFSAVGLEERRSDC